MDIPYVSPLTRISRFFRRPRQSAGNVYYARLNTPLGIFYKIGFTTKPSLHERMAYAGGGDEKLIDKVLFFKPHAKAWDVEQTLLDHFAKKRAFKWGNDPSKPLYKNGQSELFASDILGLDADLYVPRMVSSLVPSTESNEQALGGCLAVLIGVLLAPFTVGISLIFVFGGLMDFFTAATEQKTDEMNELVIPERPIHPEEIKNLLDSLSLPVAQK